MTLFKASSDIHIPHVSLKWHFSKCYLRFRSLLWDSNDTFQNVVWDSDTPFETQITLFKMLFEIHMPHLSLKCPFPKCHLRFRSLIWDSNDTFQNVIWDSDPSFETQMTLFKMSFEIQIPPLRFRSLIWVSNDTSKNVLEIQMQYFEQHVLRLKNFLNNHCRSSASAVAYLCHCHLGAHPPNICNTTIHLCIYQKMCMKLGSSPCSHQQNQLPDP